MKNSGSTPTGFSFSLAIFILFLTIFSPALNACTIPVFRYALENWKADAYAVTITHTGPLTGEAKAAADLLQTYTTDDRAQININVNYQDTRRKPDISDVPTPQMAVSFPGFNRTRKPFQETPFTKQAVRQLIDSPVRKEITKLLLGGESAVFVLLEIGDEKKDKAAAELIEQQLKLLQSTLKLPEDPAYTDGTAYSDSGFPLKITFTMLKLKRDDPAEQFLVQSLLYTESDLLELEEPMVFPVFGRGIILYALIGKGINQANMGSACSFIVGACSCIVKAQNPGVDMLLTAGWDKMLRQLPKIVEPSPPLTGFFPITIQQEPNVSTTIQSLFQTELDDPEANIPAPYSPVYEKALPQSAKSNFNIPGLAIFVIISILFFVLVIGIIITQRKKRQT